MKIRYSIAGALLAMACLASPASAQGLTSEQASDLLLDAVSIEVAQEICNNVDLDGSTLVEIGEMKHFLRGKVGMSRVDLGAAEGALAAEAKKDRAAYCLGVKQSYPATYKKLVAATN